MDSAHDCDPEASYESVLKLTNNRTPKSDFGDPPKTHELAGENDSG